MIVVFGIYQSLAPYLKIHYFTSDHEIQNITVTTLSDADVMDGYIPTSPDQQKEWGSQQLRQSLIEDVGMHEKEAEEIVTEWKGMDAYEGARYLEKFGF